MRSKVAAKPGGAEIARVLPPQKGSRDEALRLIFAPCKQGDGFRHGAIGAPGFGKTYATRIVIDEALGHGLVDVALTHDVKGSVAEFEGFECKQIAEAAGAGDSAHLVFRGDPRAELAQLEAEDVAQLGKRLVQREQLRVLLNIGELGNCLTDGGRSWRSQSTLWFSAQGRALGACMTWTVQQPKRCPDEIFDQSTTIAFHHLDARSANYLGNTLLLDQQMVDVLPQLARGEFVLWQQGLEWNRKVYRF